MHAPCADLPKSNKREKRQICGRKPWGLWGQFPGGGEGGVARDQREAAAHKRVGRFGR